MKCKFLLLAYLRFVSKLAQLFYVFAIILHALAICAIIQYARHGDLLRNSNLTLFSRLAWAKFLFCVRWVFIECWTRENNSDVRLAKSLGGRGGIDHVILRDDILFRLHRGERNFSNFCFIGILWLTSLTNHWTARWQKTKYLRDSQALSFTHSNKFRLIAIYNKSLWTFIALFSAW